MTETLKERTAKGIFWGGFSNVFQQIINLVFGIFMARILFPEDFGLVGVLSIFILCANSLQESGFSTALINKKDVTQEEYSTVFWTNVLISLFIYLFLFFSSPLIADFFEQPLLVSISKVLFISFVFNALGIVQHTMLTKNLEMGKLAIVNILSILISCSVGLTFALLEFSYWSIVIQTVTLAFVKTCILWIINRWKPSFGFKIKIIKEIFPFSVKVLFSNIISQITSGVYSLLLGKYYDEEEVGYYTQANRWYTIPFGVVYGIINATAFPVLAEVNTQEERQRLIFRKMLRFASFISFPLILGFAFVTPELIPILVTDKWLPSVPIIQILCIWGSLMPIMGMYGNVLMSQGYSGALLFLNIIQSIVLLTTLFLTIHLGIIFMLWCNLGINLIYLFALLLLTKCKLGYNVKDFAKDVFPFLGITIIIFGLVYLLVYLSGMEDMYLLLSFKIIISVILYVIVMKVSKAAIFRETSNFIQNKFLKKK